MGISRSGSTVVAYVMKEKGWKLDEAMEFVKNKRPCVNPNANFLRQLETYQGILEARLVRSLSLRLFSKHFHFVSSLLLVEVSLTDIPIITTLKLKRILFSPSYLLTTAFTPVFIYLYQMPGV
ncbi:unnamed protein product [Rodentolepis nana]|uniref:TYR_PHOSPHATASE_2 domain-containing protein n=1 Tax=Rodentolepis nana TaxID=102285 RepID=A0A0R3THC1_RODNA|nr:unnamed protein product [Rodentolepis nana]